MFRKSGKVLLCGLLLLILMCPTVHASLFPSARWNSSTENALIVGKTKAEFEGEALTILIKKKNVIPSTPSDIGYVNQIVIGEEGNYRHKFHFPYNVNDYELIVRVGNNNISESVELATVENRKLFACDLTFDTVIDGDETYIRFSSKLNNDFAEDTQYHLIIACYDEHGTLLNVNVSEERTLLYDAVGDVENVQIPSQSKRVKGFLWSSVGNCIPLAESVQYEKDFSALSWRKPEAEYENIYPMFCINDVSPISEVLVGTSLAYDTYEIAALKMKEYMLTVPKGKRAVLCNLSKTIFDPDNTGECMFDNWFWWDSGIENVINHLNEIFLRYKTIGGPDIDAMIWDFEAGCDVYNMRWEYCGADESLSDAEMEQRFDAVIQDSRYLTDIRPALSDAGFTFYTGDDHNELYYYWKTVGINASDEAKKDFCIGLNFAHQRKCDYLNQIYNAAKVYFPDIYFSNYSDYNSLYDDGGHWVSYDKEYRKKFLPSVEPDNRVSTDVGTHASPVLYGGFSSSLTNNPPVGYPFESYKATPFNGAFQIVRKMKNCAIYTENAQIMPWIGEKTWTDNNSIPMANTQYYEEAMLHIGLCNPEALLFFNAFEDEVSEGVLEKVLAELNSLAGYADRKPLTDTLPSTDARYMLTGMYSNGRNIWRITPDVYTPISEGSSQLYTKEDFLVSENPVVFRICDQTIAFPDGSVLLDDSYVSSELGYWVSTPVGTVPTEYRDSNYGEALEPILP